MTRGALTTFSIANDVAKYFAIIPAMFRAFYPQLAVLNVMHLASPRDRTLVAIECGMKGRKLPRRIAHVRTFPFGLPSAPCSRFREFRVGKLGRCGWFMWAEIHPGGGKTEIEVATAGKRPPIIQKDLERSPVGHPAQNKKTLLDQAVERRAGQVACSEM